MRSKKILLIVFMTLALIVFGSSFVYADTVSVDLKTNVQECAEGQTVILTVSLTDVNSNNGIYGVEGTLEYKTEVFESIVSDSNGNTDQITALSGWGDVTYNSSTGEFKIVTTSPVKSTKNIMQIALKVKEGATLGKSVVMLNNLVASNGTEDISTSPVTATVTVKDKSEIGGGEIIPIITTPSPAATASPTTTSSPITLVSPNTTASPSTGKLPQTGIGDSPVPILFGALVLTLVSYIAYRRYKDI